MLELNNLYNGNCVELLKDLSDESVDLVVTSPPYDTARVYNGYSFPFENIANELYRVLKRVLSLYG